jgi:hypothetical protein
VAEAEAPSRPKPRAKRPTTTRAKAPARAPASARSTRQEITPSAPLEPAHPMPARRPRRRKSETLRQPAQPPGFPPAPRDPAAAPRELKPDTPSSRDVLGTAAQAAAELAEIGLSMTARALRNAVARLPHP